MPLQTGSWVTPVSSDGTGICHLCHRLCMFYLSEQTELTGQTDVPHLLWGKGRRPDIFLHILWSNFTTTIGICTIIWFKLFVLVKGTAAKVYEVEEKQDNIIISHLLEWGMDLDVHTLQQSNVLDPFETNPNSVTSNITNYMTTISHLQHFLHFSVIFY